MHTTIRSKQALVVLSLIALTGCGGGGDGNEPISSQTNSQSGSVAGVASKGLILNGLATAYAVNSDGSRGTELTSAPTDPKTGAYQLTGLPAGVPVLIEVTRRPGQNTQMWDEATKNTLDLDDAFKLRAATVTTEGGEVALQVTPYSEMAVALAEASGGLSADNVQKANQKILAFVGEDVLSTPPTFDDTGKPTNPAAVKLAAVSELAASEGLSCVGSKQLDKVKCVVSKMATSGPSDDTLATAVNTATESVKATVSPELQAKVQPVTKQLEGLPSGPVLSAIGSAKALFASFRNLGSSLNSQDASSLSSRIKRLGDDLSVLPDALPSGLIDEIDLVSRALEQFNRVPPSPATVGNTVSLGYEMRCHYADSATLDCRSTQFFVSYSYPSATFVQYRAQLTAATAGNINVTTSMVTQQGSTSDEDGFVPSWSTAPTAGPVMGSFIGVGRGDGSNAVFNGDLAPGISDADATPQGAKVSVSLNIAFTAGTTNDRYGITGFLRQFEGITDATPFASTEILSGSYLEEQQAAPSSITTVHLDVVSTVGNAKVTGVFDTSKYLPRASNNLPGKATFTGTIVDLSDNTKLFDGSVTGDSLINARGDSATTGRTGKLSLTLYVPNLGRNITLNVNAITETAPDEYSFSGSFVDGSTLVTFEGQDNVDDSNDYVTFTSSGGVNFRITPASSRAITPLKNGSGAVIGQYDDRKAQVTYADGSYERF